jgi:hypothetical protein
VSARYCLLLFVVVVVVVVVAGGGGGGGSCFRVLALPSSLLFISYAARPSLLFVCLSLSLPMPPVRYFS